MPKNQRKHSSEFKAKVALSALSKLQTMNEIASLYEVYLTQITKWKNQLEKNASQIFSDKRKRENEDREKMTGKLYEQIGQQKVEIDWLKKSWLVLLEKRFCSLKIIIQKFRSVGNVNFSKLLDQRFITFPE